jgi:PBSX family phage terminase large subunit
MEEKLLEKCLVIARESGVPRDQAFNLVSRGYIPLPWQWKFHSAARECDKKGGPVKIGAGGARGPGKSHAVLSQIGLDDCQRVPNLKCLFLRQTGKAAQESFEDLIEKTLRGKIKYQYTPSKGILRFFNSSRILLGGFESEKDIDKYIGIEYDLIAVEELNQLSQGKIDKLEGSLRTSKENWIPRMYTSFNPGGIGHKQVKATYIEPFRAHNETKTRFIPSTYKENPHLNIEYTSYLETLGGNLGKAWREGDWDIFEGQFFNEWRNNIHVVKPFTVPLTFRRFGGYDHGRAKPACFKWYFIDFDGNVYCYRELYVNKEDNSSRWEVEQIAKEVYKITEQAGEVLEYVVADSAIFTKTGIGETIAEVLKKNGVGREGGAIPVLLPSMKDRISGWTIMHQYLYHDEHTKPKLYYFETCYDSIRTIPALIHDKNKPEDLDSDGEDHAADVDRYFLQTIRSKKSIIPLTKTEQMINRFNEKIKIKDTSILHESRWNV